MRVIVVGCGRVGAALACQLSTEQHDVRVIDRNPQTRSLLGTAYQGKFCVGNGYSRRVLEDAGVAHADAFIAVTSGDNSNVVAARTAREEYRVPLVIARIYDPRRAEIYRELGIPTVASVQWTVNEIRQMLLHRHLFAELTFGNGETVLLRTQLPPYLAGRRTFDLEVDGEIRVVEITRGGRSTIPAKSALLEPDDLVTFVVAAGSLDRLRSFVGKELGT